MTAEPTLDLRSIFLRSIQMMTQADALAFIERTRRQLDCFELLPGGADNHIAPEEANAIRQLCDELEFSLYNTD